MWDRIYVDEKLRALESERLARRRFAPEQERGPSGSGPLHGVRAAFASRLARLALFLHREAAIDVAHQLEAESQR